ncbi:MAG: GNAT family N-acetyltransferase [Rhodothermia bacterium]|nr:GNAT family N-acetyltransferase [Rhodothermia bacterium]
MSTSVSAGPLRTVPVTGDLWKDLERLFGERGACGGCWCMVWRLSHKEYEAGKGAPNKRRLKGLVDSGAMPGILGYIGGQPIAWCAVAPREDYGFLSRSRVLAPVDDEPVWSISCLFVDKSYRRQGVSTGMICAAVDFAASRCAAIVEAYPVDKPHERSADAFVWTGVAAAYRKAGFHEVMRRSETRPILRYFCEPRDQAGSHA